MDIALHNSEHYLLIAIGEFAWPLAFVFVRILFSPGRSRGDSFRAATLIIGTIGLFDLFLLSSVESDDFRNVAKDCPPLAICAALALVIAGLSLSMQWRANSLDSQDALGGILEQPLVARGDRGRAIAKYLGIIAAALATLFLLGLFILAR